MNIKYEVTNKDVNINIKDILRNKMHISTRLLNKLKLLGRIKINEKIAMVNNNANIGDVISINFDYEEEDYTIPQKNDLEILYEDDWYLAVNKPANLVVHPSVYHPDNTLANFVKYYLNNNKKIRPVNRLDNGTSGIVLFAKNEYAQESFINLSKENQRKEYIALVEGILELKKGILDFPISRKENSIIERCVDYDKGQKSITHYEIIKEITNNNEKYSLVKIFLETGRTHQIRVHFAHIGHPLVGDSLYNDKYKNYKDKTRQLLHAYKLEFKHPITNEQISIVSDYFNVDKEMEDISITLCKST